MVLMQKTKKKAYFFTLDALLSLSIMVIGLMLISNVYVSSQPRTQLDYYSEDLISLFSDIKLDEINNSYINKLIADGNITDTENSILEQIGIFWVTNKTDLAQNLARNISYSIIPDRYGYAFVVGGDIVYSEPKNKSRELTTHKSMITGIEKSRPIKGNAARIFLNQITQTLSTQYAFLGGFVGQGNITRFINGIPIDANITYMSLEVDAGDNFSLYINDVFCDFFNFTHENMTSHAWDISYCNASIVPGHKNNFSFVFNAMINKSFIGGGFIKVSYITKNILLKNSSSDVYTFPGIDGIVNLYDGFDVPGTLNNMNIYLHYFANHSNSSNNTFYLTIGNTTIFKDNYSNSTMQVTINNSYLSSLLNYSFLSNQTVPIRVGFENLSFEYVITDKGNGDVVSITDVSGSMGWEFNSGNTGLERFCKNLKLNDEDTMRLSLAKCILKTFAHDILYNITGNQVGLVTYSNSVRDSLGLITNLTKLTDEINSYYASGSTCTSCGVVEAANHLLGQSSTDMLNKAWKFTNDFQTSDPIGWTSIGFNDNSWLNGNLNFGHGHGSDYYTGNVIFANLWDMTDDNPAPVDFTSGVNYTYNTFGFINLNVVENVLQNSYFDGPSASDWTERGMINLSDAPNIAFSDDFETDLGWTNGGTREQWHYGTPLGRGGTNHGNPDPDFAHSGTHIWGEDCTNPSWNGDYRSNADSRLTSPDIDCTACTNTILRFFKWLNVEDPTWDQSRVSVRDSGGSWHTVWTNPSEITDNSWNLQEIDIQAFADNNPNLAIRFGTQSDGGWEYSGWNVDDVEVYSDVGTNNYFGLDDFWFVDADTSSHGSLRQSFNSPTDTPIKVTINLVHSINNSHFTGSADVFCNLTHPGGNEEVWHEYWRAGSLPGEGPITEVIDITSKITSKSFDYILECGANISGSNTMVAFDNITVAINWTNNGDDGWDYKAGEYGYDAEASFYVNAWNDLEMTTNRTSNDMSGSFGIQVEITQEMIDVMNSAGGAAWISFDYRWDSADSTGNIFEADDEVWVKGYWNSSASGVHYFGGNYDGGHTGSDGTPEIWAADDPDTEVAKRYSQDISAWIDAGPGNYYLALGGKLLRSQSIELGAWSFDNIQLAFTNNSGNTFYRNEFFINDISSVNNPITLEITSDGGADVYLNDNQIDTYNTPQTGRNIVVTPANFKQGDNILAIKLKNNDPLGRLSVNLNANITERQKAMVIMSDGESNDCIGDYGTGQDGNCNDCAGRPCCPGPTGIIDQPCPTISDFDVCTWSDESRRASEQLVNLTCYYASQNVSIYSVAFGDVAVCGKMALNLSAICDPDYTTTNSHFFESDDPEGLAHIYGHIANELRLAFSLKKSQIVSFQGQFESSTLYPDSYIFLNYTPIVQPMIYGEIPFYFETDDFNGCIYDVDIPPQIRPFEAYLLSYSAEHWTNYVAVENSLGTHVAFNLSRFNNNYANLGDPFPIPIPGSFFVSGETNRIIVNTGDNPFNSTNCSLNTTMLYTGLLNMINYTLPYSSVHPNATGCNWTIEHDLGYNFSLAVPTDYTGTIKCYFTNETHDTSGFDNDDAFNWAMYNFLSHMDYDNDGRVFLNLLDEDFVVSSRIVTDVPYLWGPTIAEVRVWQ